MSVFGTLLFLLVLRGFGSGLLINIRHVDVVCAITGQGGSNEKKVKVG